MLMQKLAFKSVLILSLRHSQAVLPSTSSLEKQPPSYKPIGSQRDCSVNDRVIKFRENWLHETTGYLLSNNSKGEANLMKSSFLKHYLILAFSGGSKVERANLFIPLKISYLPHCGGTLVFPLGTVDTILFFVQ